ncbi:glycosyltransferase [Alkalicoccus chagannorensis]|uniref:glycosyltransferase n=1 Tax=Alkalicoccus chagannorensis TaxID=427072 RepID=UPI00040725D3|nr:glycosyltransferase [Alkalicoccus chagannorensis]
MKRVLHVTGRMNRAGTETMLMNVYRELDRSRIQFDFVSFQTEAGDYDDEIRELGGRVLYVSDQTSIRALYRVMKVSGPYDAVHAHTMFHCGMAMAAAKLAGVPVRISHAHTTQDDTDSLLRSCYRSLMRNMIQQFSTDTVSCSAEAAACLYGREGGLHLPNYVPYERMMHCSREEIEAFKQRWQIGDEMVLGHIGRFIEPKNHAHLLQVTKALVDGGTDVTLLLVGEGETLEKTKALAARLGIRDRVRFTGALEDVRPALHAMSCFLFPSYYEGLGLVLLEAQAAGVPCLVSEAVQPEADLGLHLLRRCRLADGAAAWADAALTEAAVKPHVPVPVRRRAFEQQGRSMSDIVDQLRIIYGAEEEERHEQNVDRLV